MNIRRLAEGDRALYLEMTEEFYHSPAVLHAVPKQYFENTFEEMMRSDVYVEGFLLKDDKHAPAGYAITSKMFSQEVGGMVAWIEEIYVRPDFQGQGMGKQFFAYFEELHPELRRVRLEVEPDNERAVKLYERLGFERVAYYQMGKDKPE